MQDILQNNMLAAGYLIFWIIAFGVYHYKKRKLDAGSLVFGMQIIYALCSIHSINNEYFASYYEPLTLFPYIYLSVMLLVGAAPIIYTHSARPIEAIQDPQTRLLTPLCWLIVASALLILPGLFSNMGVGIIRLMLDSEAGQEAYLETMQNATDSGGGISSLPSIIFNAFSDLSIFLLLYQLTLQKKNYPLIAGLLVALVVTLLLPVVHGQRTGVINSLLTLLACYLMFKERIGARLQKWVRNLGLIIMLGAMVPVAAITLSRFGERSEGVVGYLTWYIGQGSLYFNNYGLDAGGIRYGDRTFNLLKRVINSDTPINYVERREKYHNLNIDDYYFTTYVGDFCIDFGPILAVIIIAGFSLWVMNVIYRKERTWKMHQLLLLYLVVCINIQGGMYLFAYSDTAGLKMIVLLLLAAYLYIHDLLLEKYPSYATKQLTE